LPVPAPGDEAPGEVVAHLLVLSRLHLRRVVRGEHLLDRRAPLHPAAVRIGIDPLRAQPLHLGPALVALDQLLAPVVLLLGGGRLRRCLLGRAVGLGGLGAGDLLHGGAGALAGGAVVVLLFSPYGHVTILSSGFCLSSAPGGPAWARIAD